jgi:hopene-associated glycosyltransferase HpnB
VIAFAVAVASLAAWGYLLAARGEFWRCAERDDADAADAGATDETAAWPAVAIIVPARNEADVIGDTLGALLRQDYRGEVTLVVVDDGSADETARVSREVARSAGAVERVSILHAPAVPPGWTGKVWAMHCGIGHAAARAPEYLLLTDADIRHAHDSLRGLVARARAASLVLASRLAKLRCESLAERALVPAFVFFFRMLYPFAWVNAAHRRVAAAAGGCMLVRRETLDAAGGLQAIRGELIDDCALARLLKSRGPVSLTLSTRVESLRAYRSFGALRRMIGRCAFSELRYSWSRLALATTAMLVVFAAPPVVVVAADAAAAAVAGLAWLAMAIAFQPTLSLYARSPLWGLALPAIALVYLGLTIDSALAHARGCGGEWKGRVHARSAPP